MDTFDVTDMTSPRNLSILFRVGMWWRIIYGSLRLLLGLFLLKIIGTPFTDIFVNLFSHEISEDPRDALFRLIYGILENHAFTVTYFVAAYLIFWGTVEILLSWALLVRMKAAFPLAMALIVLFICYALWRFTHTHSLVLGCIILIDIGILYLVNNEYRRLKGS